MTPPRERPVYYHGGPSGLTAIMPPTATGAPSNADYGAEKVCRRDRVYLTTDPKAAAVFAMLAPTSGEVSVYEVSPHGDVVPDPDCNEPGLSWECESAVVERVVERFTREQRRTWISTLGACR